MATDKYLAAAIGDCGNCQMCVKNCKDAAVAIIHGEAHVYRNICTGHKGILGLSPGCSYCSAISSCIYDGGFDTQSAGGKKMVDRFTDFNQYKAGNDRLRGTDFINYWSAGPVESILRMLADVKRKRANEEEAAVQQAERKRQEAAQQAKRERYTRIIEATKHIKIPETHGVVRGDILPIDNESLNWNVPNLSGFFDDVSIADLTPRYSLAIRKWEPDSSTDLALPKDVDWKNETAFAEIKTAIEDEFGDDVMFRVQRGALLLQNGHED